MCMSDFNYFVYPVGAQPLLRSGSRCPALRAYRSRKPSWVATERLNSLGKLLRSITFCKTMSSVITVRIPREMKEKLEKYNINISETVRELLGKYLVELETKELEERLEQLKERLGDKIDPSLIARLIREEREGR